MKQDSAKPASDPVAPANPGAPKVNTRLAIAAAMTIEAGRALQSTRDLFRFEPPAEPPKLQKPNRKARRAVKARTRTRKS